MLTQCPECELPVSDKAFSCPHCGYPLKENIKPRTKSKSRMRLPNGFGQISEIKDRNLRNPWRAMVTVGKDSKGRPISKLLKPQAYFKSYNEAYAALVEYNRNPYDLDDDITVKQLYDRWSEKYFENLKSDSSRRTITAAWAYCSNIYDMRVKDVRARHIKGCMDEGFINIKGEQKYASPNTKGRIKSLFNLMLDYAVEYELTDRNYARTFEVDSEISEEIKVNHRGHISFSDEEMKKLMTNINTPYVDLVLVQCFMGWRPQELGLIEVKNVDLERSTITGGMKTPFGINRTAPIHPFIKPIIEKKYHEAMSNGSEYLFTAEGKKLTYDKYAIRFKKIVESLGLNPEHRAHDPRKQFVTMAKKYQVDEYAIKRIIGHRIEDITEAVYTDRETSWFLTEVEKIKAEDYSA